MQHKEVLVQNYLEKSDEALKSAQFNLKNDFLPTAQNRIYYAIFYAVSALALKYDFTTSKHKQLMGWFNKKFLHEEKAFKPEIFIVYKEAYEARQKSDYEVIWKPVKKEITRSLNLAKDFVDEIKGYLS